MRTPMPSPNGTNRAGLFIEAPGLAYDAKPRYARDQAPDKTIIRSLLGVIDGMRPKGVAADDMAAPDHELTTDIENLRNLLHTQLPHDAFREVDEALTKMAADARELIKATNVAANKEIVGDDPPNFPGKPIPGGGKAMDAAFNKRFPNAARIGVSPPYDVQPPQRGSSQSAAQAASFNKRFPNAARIGGV